MPFQSNTSVAFNADRMIAELTAPASQSGPSGEGAPARPPDQLSMGAQANGQYDWGMLFTSTRPDAELAHIMHSIQDKVKVTHFLGCTCAGIIGTNQEIEYQAGATLMLASMPQVKIRSFYMDQKKLQELTTKEQWYEFFEVYPHENPVFICLLDPYQMDLTRFIYNMNQVYPLCPVVGGLASGGYNPNGNRLMLNGKIYREGLVGLILTGNIKVNTVVSQGCRPVGEPYIITKAERNVILELGGRKFLDILREIFEKASERDRKLVQEALFVGIAMNEYTHEFKRGDFLIRTVLAIDEKTGAGVIGDAVRPGQTVQIHLRDAQTATEDLNEMLKSYQKIQPPVKPYGALLFSCNGRGQQLFKEPNHDIRIVQQYLGGVPVAGFFCAGEIGPVGGKTFIHGFTDSLALFYRQDELSKTP